MKKERKKERMRERKKEKTKISINHKCNESILSQTPTGVRGMRWR